MPRVTMFLLACFTLVSFGFAAVGCGQLKEEGGAVARDVVDCTTSSALQAIEQYGPTVKQVILDSMDGSGKIDKERVRSVAKSYATDSAKCVLASTIARLLKPAAAKPGAPESSPQVADPVGLEELRREELGGARYKLPDGTTL